MEEDYDVRLSNVHRHTAGSAGRDIDITRIESGHAREHSDIGMDVDMELTAEELDRPHLVLKAPSEGLVDEPSVTIGEHILQCLVVEEMKAWQM